MGSPLPWFKHYNTAHEGRLVGNLIAAKKYDAALLWWVILEFVSRFEDKNNRGKCIVPLARISKVMNMKQSRTERLLNHIAIVSQSDLICEIEEKEPRNVSLVIRNWLDLQETRGGKRLPKSEQNDGRGKRKEVRGKIVDVRNMSSTEKFELMRTPEAGTLKVFFNDNRMSQLENIIPEILKYFVNVESFDNWYQGLVNSKTFPKDQDFANQSRYITTSLKRELGLIPSEAANA